MLLKPSLLRVFDPLEMYGVLETLQTTIQQLQSEKRLPSTFADAPTLDIDSPTQVSLTQSSGPQSSAQQSSAQQSLAPQPLAAQASENPSSAPQSSTPLSVIPEVRASSPLAHDASRVPVPLTSVPSDVSACVEQLSQRLKIMEATLAEWSCKDGDRHQKAALHADLDQVLHAVQHLEQLLKPVSESMSVSVSAGLVP